MFSKIDRLSRKYRWDFTYTLAMFIKMDWFLWQAGLVKKEFNFFKSFDMLDRYYDERDDCFKRKVFAEMISESVFYSSRALCSHILEQLNLDNVPIWAERVRESHDYIEFDNGTYYWC